MSEEPAGIIIGSCKDYGIFRHKNTRFIRL